MFQNQLKMTRFEVERLEPVRTESRLVPFLINTFHGKCLGAIGCVASAGMPASNDSDMSLPVRLSRRVAGHFFGGFGLKQLLTIPVW